MTKTRIAEDSSDTTMQVVSFICLEILLTYRQCVITNGYVGLLESCAALHAVSVVYVYRA